MKQYINYVVLSLLSTVAMFSACDMEEPEIPMVNYRYVTSEKEITNFPEGISSGYELSNRFLFSINNSLYFTGDCYETTEGTIYGRIAIYEYNTNTGKWKMVWCILEKEIWEWEQKEDPTGENWEKAELLRRMADNVAMVKNETGNTCTYNGKGYIFGNDMILIFSPSTNEFAISDYNNTSYYNPIHNVFSTTRGVFGLSNYNPSELYQYTSQNYWVKVGDIPYELIENSENNGFQLLSQQENLYIWRGYSDNQFSIERYPYPYNTMDKYNIISRPRDYGWTNGDYLLSQPTASGDKLFCISNKIYKTNYVSHPISFYEYDPTNDSVSFVLLKNTSYDTYSYDLLTVIGNKLYFTNSSQSIIEITF